jgi:hypothetical protein
MRWIKIREPFLARAMDSGAAPTQAENRESRRYHLPENIVPAKKQ